MAISSNCMVISIYAVFCYLCIIFYPACITLECIGIEPIQAIWCVCKATSICLIYFGCCNIILAITFFIIAQICRCIVYTICPPIACFDILRCFVICLCPFVWPCILCCQYMDYSVICLICSCLISPFCCSLVICMSPCLFLNDICTYICVVLTTLLLHFVLICCSLNFITLLLYFTIFNICISVCVVCMCFSPV
jgi:hypothetical protein